MKKIKPGFLVKMILLAFWLVLLIVFGRNIYVFLRRAKKVDPKMVESFQPYLNVDQVKEAAEILQGKKQ